MIISVTCANCGGVAALNIEPPFCGGFSATCRNCGALVTGSYSWDNNVPRLYNIRAMGGLKRR